jgi:Tfp pilus assembly protein PilF
VVEIVPGDRAADLATLEAVRSAAQRGEHARAAELARVALAAGLEHPLLLNVVALAVEQQGQLVRAEQLLRRAVQIAPTDIGARNALGLLLLRQERPQEALTQFETILAANPQLAYVHASRAYALLSLADIGKAEASYRRALELDANHGVALAGLAHIASRRGAYRDAQVWAEKALAVLPGLPDAVMSLASAELGQRQIDRAEARIRELLEAERVSSIERAYAHGLLGDILDAAGRTTEAINAYTACNTQLQREYAPLFHGEVSALEYVRAMTRYFEHARPEVWASAPAVSEESSGVGQHVFLLGFPRSGTTLLEMILEGHPNVVSLEEQELLLGAVREFMQRPEDLERLPRAGALTIERLRADYWRLVAQGGAQVRGKTFVDKYPFNTLKLPLIAQLFPRAKILFACRDPRDIVLSCFRHRFRMTAPLYELLTLEGAARYYDAVMQLLVRLTGILTLDICLVRHEDLVTAFPREMKRICDFMGLDWVPAMGDFALRTRDRTVLTPSTAQLVRGLNTEGLGQWRRYRAHLEPVLPRLAPWVQRFYYDP